MKERRSPAWRVAGIGMMVSVALMLSLLERMLPPVAAAAPGIKLGLANVVVLLVLYQRGPWEALLVNALRVLMAGLLFTNLQTLLYSAVGAAVSYLVMVLLKKTGWFSVVGVSIAGAVCHNAGQLLVAVWITRSPVLWGYLPVLVLAGAVTGLLMGLVARGVLHALPRLKR